MAPSKKIAGVAGAAVVLATATWLWSSKNTQQSTPAAGTAQASMPVTRQPYDPRKATQTVEFWRQRVQYDPQSAVSYRELAAAYLARQRENADITDAVRAEAAARRSLAILPKGNSAALQRLSRSLMTQHRFPEAMAVAERAVALDPDAQRLRVDLLLEQGQYTAAFKAYQRIPIEPNARNIKTDLNRLALRSRILESEGKGDEALKTMMQAQRQAQTLHGLPAETAAWYHVMVGHALIDGGQLDEGEAACREALEIFPRDYRALTGLAEAAMWRQDWKAAIELAQKSFAITGQNPEILLLLGDAYTAQGDKQQAKKYYGLFEKLATSFPRIYDRNYIHFLADQERDLDKALALARQDLKLRQDPGAHATLAWVLHRRDDTKAAYAAMQKALATPSHDASTWYHAALIARANGQTKNSQTYMDRSKEANPYFLKSVEVL